MFATVGIALLLVVRGLRLPELFGVLQPLPIVPLAFAFAFFGLVVDLKLRKSQLLAAPQLPWAAAFFACALAGVAVVHPPGARALAVDLVASFALYLLLAQGVQSFRALAIVAGTLVALALAGATVALLPSSPLGAALAAAAGDPEAQAPALGLAVPLAFALHERKRTLPRLFLSIVTLLAVGLCVVLTRSRPGQIVTATVIVAYFVLRWRARGLLAAVVLAVPLFLFGGHAAAAAPRQGTGGLPGLAAAAVVLFLSFKIAVVLLRRYAGEPEANAARTWARALLAALAGVAVGLFFVPPGGSAVFWIYAGLSAALYQATRAHDPQLGPVLIRKVRE